MIHHITRVISRSALPDSIVFYGILGFEPVDVPQGIVGRAVWLESTAESTRGVVRSQVHLMPADDATPDAGHFGLVCSDYEATLARLREAGVTVDPRREHWGSPRAYVRDPAGNLVELMAWPPGAPARADRGTAGLPPEPGV